MFRGIQASAQRVYRSASLEGKSVAVQGVGSVGGYLCEHLADAGAKLFITDADEDALSRIQAKTDAQIVGLEEIYTVEADIFSPNALGAIINENTVPKLKSRIVAGGANNQLSGPEIGEALRNRDILYAPDYVINGGGIINVAAEISGEYSRNWVDQKLDTLMTSLGEVLDLALSQARPTNLVADEIARTRIGRS